MSSARVLLFPGGFLLWLSSLCRRLGLVPSLLRRTVTAVIAPYPAKLINVSALPVAACGL